MDNLTEEDMKKYDAYITVMEVNPSENCKSLLFNGSDDISVTNHQNKYFPSSLRNEPQMGVVKHKIRKLEPQNTVSDDSEIKIYGQRGQIKTIIISAATKNTNLLTRRTENDSLNVETFSFPKNYSSSSPLVKSNQIKILSTATVTMPKTKTTYSQLKLSNNTEIGQNNSYNMLRVGDFSNASKIKKYIPHTITSRDLMENDSNTFVQNEEFKKVTNCPKKLNTSSCQLSSNSESIEKSESSLLSYRQGQWASKNGWY